MFKKMLTIISFCLVFSVLSHGQNVKSIVGDYQGQLDVKVTKLRLVFHITKEKGVYKASVDSIDQGVKGIPVSEVSFDGKNLKLTLPSIRVVYSGVFKDEKTVEGKWTQGGQSFPLTIIKTLKPAKLVRFQNPKKPYPYVSEDVFFTNKLAKIKLAGTFTFPKKQRRYPAVILISGSGAQNRNEELLGHKPFLVLSDFLTRNNIAVLRFDDRGVAESEGIFKNADSFDFANDVEAAIEFLKTRKEVDCSKIGLIGHSEGGIIAPIVASRNNAVSFVVMLAGPSVSGDKILIAQNKLLFKSIGMDEEHINKYAKQMRIELDSLITNEDVEKGKKELVEKSSLFFDENFKNYGGKFGMVKENIKKRAEIYSTKWFRTFISIEPYNYLIKTKVPVLALYGEKDTQVPPSINTDKAKAVLKKSGNKKSKMIVVSNCNHLFQTCKTGNIAEYAKIDETISPKVLDIILKWIVGTVENQ